MPSEPSSGTSSSTGRDLLLSADVLFGCSPAMSIVRQRAEKICSAGVQVLLCGDGGTGKEALARWIHANSASGNGPFVSVNCAAIPRTLLESELFGYEKGAFTGAWNAKPGRVELAEDGTLFLDEIGEMDPELQSKLLHFLQDESFSRIGDLTERKSRARVICATSVDLEGHVAAKKFRADLFHRINVVQLRLPPLRERSEDIPILAEHFRTLYVKQFGREAEPLGRPVVDYLTSLRWPGNIRELANCIARYVLVGPDATIENKQPTRPGPSITARPMRAGSVPLKRIASEAIRELERNLILEALRANRWNRRKTAQTLKISYRTLIYKIRDAGLAHRKPRPVTDSASNSQASPKTRFPSE